MKNLISLMLIAFALTTMNSCAKDGCKEINCLNGGVCIDGTCSCPTGYSGVNCENFNPCVNVTCLNGGYCANGQCVCPQGYTGSNCSQQVTPTQMRITKIEVTRFPATDGGAGWDLTSGPDIYTTFALGSSTIWNSPIFYQNANPGTIYEFVPNPAIVINSPISQYTIRLFDYDDLDPDDFMGGINFTPYNSAAGFPSVATIDAGGAVAFRLTYTYSW
jgi:hypothetical protein